MTVYEQLVAILSEVPGFHTQLSEEDNQKYFARLLLYMNDDTLWDKFSEETQGWYNDQIDEAGELKKPLTEPDGFVRLKEPKMRRRTIAVPTPPEVKAAEEAAAAAATKTDDHAEEGENGPLPASIANHLESVAAGETLKKGGRKKAPQEPKLRPGRQPNPNSVITAIREEVTKDPNITPDTLKKKILERHLYAKESTLHQTKAAHLASLRVAKSMGWSPPTKPIA